MDNLDNDDLYRSWKETFPKLAYQLNFCDGNIDSKFKQETVLADLVYPKVLQMIDRKQEKERRVRASLIIADLLSTQGAKVLTSKEFSKMFLTMARDNYFGFRANMAAKIGNIIAKRKPDGGE